METEIFTGKFLKQSVTTQAQQDLPKGHLHVTQPHTQPVEDKSVGNVAVES